MQTFTEIRGSAAGGQKHGIRQPLTRLCGTAADPLPLLWVVLLTFAAGCVYVPSVMWRRAEENRARLNRIEVGRTIAQVRALMGKEPERREARLRFDGKKVELWSYVSDYGRKLDTTLIFVDGVLQEIRTTSWEEKD